MNTPETNESSTAPDAGGPLSLTFVRASIGGVLMGLANLVPGISGGTMLLATGVYTRFITAIAEVTTLRFRVRSLVVLAGVVGAAALAILLLAGSMRTLVIEQRWLMYSLFIGLTLGGVPLVWKLVRPATTSAWVGAGVAFALMVVLAFGFGGSRGGDASLGLLFVSGLAGASAMILPGISGGYLLLLLGQYEVILGAIDLLKQGLLGDGGPHMALLIEAMWVCVPVGLGVVAGIVGVSNLLGWLLERYEKPTLGVLLGLLLGSVVGLWPFQQPQAPEVGDDINGQIMTADNVDDIKPKHWALERYTPSAGQAGGSAALILLGLGLTLGIARIGGGDEDEDQNRGSAD